MISVVKKINERSQSAHNPLPFKILNEFVSQLSAQIKPNQSARPPFLSSWVLKFLCSWRRHASSFVVIAALSVVFLGCPVVVLASSGVTKHPQNPHFQPNNHDFPQITLPLQGGSTRSRRERGYLLPPVYCLLSTVYCLLSTVLFLSSNPILACFFTQLALSTMVTDSEMENRPDESGKYGGDNGSRRQGV